MWWWPSRHGLPIAVPAVKAYSQGRFGRGAAKMAGHRTVFLAFSLVLVSAGCSKTPYDNALPDSGGLGSPRGYRVARVLTHLHSPYSYDACDRNGSPGGAVNQEWLS